MSHPELIESADRLVIHSPVPIGRRLFFAGLGVLPLLAPYELLIKPNWQHYRNPVFFFVMVISMGAIAISALLFFAAVAGLSSTMVFDRSTATFNYSFLG